MGQPVVDGARLWASLEEISRIGATPPGGLHRLAASREDGLARDLVVGAAREVGARVRVDAIGNVFLTREGVDPRAAGVLVGSHVDSQPTAGAYDGTYGVMAGLEVLRALQDVGLTPQRSVTLAIWTNEEGARFTPAMMGSSVFARRLPLDLALATTDGDGVALRPALERIGYAGTDVVDPEEFCVYLEAHIEQGPTLEQRGLDVGVVTGVQAQYWIEVRITGAQAHAGTFPMESRRDALVAAAELVLAVRGVGLARPGIGRATVGRLAVRPDTPNVVPGVVDLVVELRHPQAGELDRMHAELHDLLGGIGERHGVAVSATTVLASAPITFDPRVVDVVAAAADRLGLSHDALVSGAGHDAVPVADRIPAGMVFIPCHGGVSHAESESISPDWAATGARLLLESVLTLAEAP